MIEETIVAALRASLGKADALTALALVELRLSQAPSACSEMELTELINKWGQTLVGVGAADVESLKRRLRQSGKFLESSAPAPE